MKLIYWIFIITCLLASLSILHSIIYVASTKADQHFLSILLFFFAMLGLVTVTSIKNK